MGSNKNVYGEGNYEATHQYNAATKKFLQSGRVEQAARNAEPRTPQEAAVMQEAEKAGLMRHRDAGSKSGTNGKATAPKGAGRRR